MYIQEKSGEGRRAEKIYGCSVVRTEENRIEDKRMEQKV
jgi:hypothetical protein